MGEPQVSEHEARCFELLIIIDKLQRTARELEQLLAISLTQGDKA